VEVEAMMLTTRGWREAFAGVIFMLSLTGASSADDTDFAVVIEGRQSNLRDLGAAFKAISDELKKSVPSRPLIKQYAAQIEDLSKQQRFWFPVGSGPQPDVKTKAKAEIWTKPGEFTQAQIDFMHEAEKLLEVVTAGELAAIKSQYQVLGNTCQGCHKQFREKADD
jgi:cytochrome c556